MTFIEVSNEAHRRIWRLSRPERGNALGTLVAAELLSALADMASMRPEQRALVITATPVVNGARRTWVAGGDLKELAQLDDAAAAGRYAATLTAVCRGLDALPVPVLIAVDGDAIGGGAELAMSGDLRFATAASSLEFKQLRVGLATGYGSARRLIDMVGLGRAQALLYLAPRLSADQAQALGLITAVVADAEALAALVDATCTALAALSPEAVAGQKRMFLQASTLHPGATATAETALFQSIWRNPLHSAFLERFAADASPPQP